MWLFYVIKRCEAAPYEAPSNLKSRNKVSCFLRISLEFPELECVRIHGLNHQISHSVLQVIVFYRQLISPLACDAGFSSSVLLSFFNRFYPPFSLVSGRTLSRADFPSLKYIHQFPSLPLHRLLQRMKRLSFSTLCGGCSHTALISHRELCPATAHCFCLAAIHSNLLTP